MYVDNWLKGNKLSLNVMKTHSMLISTKPKLKALKSKNESLRLKIHEDELEVVQKTKYLAVQIDNSQKQLGFYGMLSPFYQKRHLRLCTQGLLSHIFATVV